MAFLYGDSTPSALQVNFIEFLQDALDCSVQMLLADGRLVERRTGLRAREAAAADEIAGIQKLDSAVADALKNLGPGGPESQARCVGAILGSVENLVRTEVANVRSAVAGEAAQLEAQAAEERDACFKALQQLLTRHDLPQSVLTAHLAMVAGTRYA